MRRRSGSSCGTTSAAATSSSSPSAGRIVPSPIVAHAGPAIVLRRSMANIASQKKRNAAHPARARREPPHDQRRQDAFQAARGRRRVGRRRRRRRRAQLLCSRIDSAVEQGRAASQLRRPQEGPRGARSRRRCAPDLNGRAARRTASVSATRSGYSEPPRSTIRGRRSRRSRRGPRRASGRRSRRMSCFAAYGCIGSADSTSFGRAALVEQLERRRSPPAGASPPDRSAA